MPRKEPVPPTHLYSDEASWAAIGTNLAKISGPVTAGSVGFTGKGFTKGAPKSREYHRDQTHRKTQGSLLPIPSSSANPIPQFPLSCQTFYRLKGIQCWHRLMVDKVIILLGRIIPGSQGRNHRLPRIHKLDFHVGHCFLPTVQRNTLFNKKEPHHPSPTHLLSPNDIHSKSKRILHSVRLALCR